MPTSIELTPEIMREIIMDHCANPRHKRKSVDPKSLTAHSESVNCIDDIDVFLTYDENGRVKDACWDGVACSITTASSDILCDLLTSRNFLFHIEHPFLKDSEIIISCILHCKLGICRFEYHSKFN